MNTKNPQTLALSRPAMLTEPNSTNFETALFKLIVLVCLITLASPAWSLTTNQRVALLEEYVVGLKDRMNTLEAANNNLATQVNTLNTQIASLTGTNTALSDRISSLEANVNNLTDANAQLTNTVTALQADNAAVKSQIASVQSDLDAVKNNSVLALDQILFLQNGDAVFKGVNVQVVNGLGKTDSTNGKGNLILGYNEYTLVTGSFCSNGAYISPIPCGSNGYKWESRQRSGSHNIVSGVNHNYTQYGGVVLGFGNVINSPWSTVTGGAFNTAGGPASSVTGGAGNIARGENASVSGGTKNVAAGIQSSVTGGSFNTAGGRLSSVSGGNQRSAVNTNEWAAGSLFEFN